MKLVSKDGFKTSLPLIIAICLTLPFVIIAQRVRSRDIRESLRLIETIGSAQDEIFQATFNNKGELFVLSRNRVDDRWEYRIGNVKKSFSPCGGGRIVGGDYGGVGDFLSIKCIDSSVEVWDLEHGKRISRLQIHNDKESGSPQPYTSFDGKRVLITFSGIGEYAELWDAVNGRKLATLTSDDTTCLCNRSIYYANGFSPDGKIAVVSFGAMTFLWNADTGKLMSRLVDKNLEPHGIGKLTHGNVVSELLFSKDGKTLITGSYDERSKSWNAETGELLVRFERHGDRITSLALSPNEKVLATGSRNQDFKLWERDTGKLLLTSKDHKRTVRILSFSPDGKKLLSMTSNHAFIWDVITGDLIEEMQTPGELTARFNADWKLVIMPDEKTKTLGLYEYVGP